jgi:hypothetical protein
MSRYIKSELYRLLRIKATYLFVIICSLLLVSSNIVLFAVKMSEKDFPYATTKFSFGNVESSMIMLLFLCIMVATLVFGNEYNNHTMKNSISFGLTRNTLYFGKFIVQLIYAIAAFVIIIGSDVLSAYLLLENSGTDNLLMLLKTCFICLPLFFSSLALTNCFAFLFEGTGATVASCFGVLLAIPLISNLLAMKFEVIKKFADILPYNMIGNLKFDFKAYTLSSMWGADSYQNFWIIGILEMIFFVIIGYIVFRKREIK